MLDCRVSGLNMRKKYRLLYQTEGLVDYISAEVPVNVLDCRVSGLNMRTSTGYSTRLKC